MVKIFYKDVKCAVEDQGEIGERFYIKTGVKGGCNMSGFLFLISVSGQRSANKMDAFFISRRNLLIFVSFRRGFFIFFVVPVILWLCTLLVRIYLQVLIGVLYMQLIVCTAVVFFYSLQLMYFFFVCLCVHLFIHNKLISSYFSAWPSHSARLDLLFLSGCALLFSQLFTFNVFALLYQEHNKDCC